MARLDFKVYRDGTVYLSDLTTLAQDRRDEEVGGGDPNLVMSHVKVEVKDEGTGSNVIGVIEHLHGIQMSTGTGRGPQSGVEIFLTALVKAVRELPAE